MSALLDFVQKYNFNQIARTEAGNAVLYCSPEDFRELRALAARLAAEERMVRQAARLLRDYEADAHPEDVQDVIRWLAVYDSREQRATDSADVSRD